MSELTDRRRIRVLVFAASLRRASWNRRLAELAVTVVKEQGGTADQATMADFDCPPYNADVERESGVPPGAERLRECLVAADAFVISSPEYNASMPGYLKNAIDWASRIRPQPFNGRQGMLLSASPSMAGGNRGLWSLRVPLEHLGARVYPDMFSLAQAHEAFDGAGRIASPVLQERFERTIVCFLELVEAAKHYRPLKKLWVEHLGERPDAAIDRVEHTPTQAD
jgi:chromate reductase, NAD(P)H dehydrogenase (quinone)